MTSVKSNIYGTIFVVLICLIFVSANSVSQRLTTKPPSSFEISILTSKEEFLLGEPVELNIQIKNKGQYDASPGPHTVRSSMLDVLIADAEMNFLSFKFIPGTDDSGALIKAGQTLDSHETVFFNEKPVVSHLSEKAAREVSEGRILTDYAFPKPGLYKIKARLRLRPGKNDFLESPPIEIKINPAEGDDLKVWNIIESDIRIGYFLQHGAAGNLYPNTEASLMQEIDEIVADHPDSYLAGILRDKVASLRARREKGRIEQNKFDEKVKRMKEQTEN